MARKSSLLTDTDRDQYLELLAQGYSSGDAAREVNADYTGTMFRQYGLLHPDWGERRNALLDESRERRRQHRQELAEEVEAVLLKRALDVMNDAAGRERLYYLRVNHEDWQILNQTRLAGPTGGPIEVAHVDDIDREIRKLLGEMAARDEAAAAEPLAGETLGGAG